jgi:hypothetical protein
MNLMLRIVAAVLWQLCIKSLAIIVRKIAERQKFLQASIETSPWRITFLMWKFGTAERAAELSHAQNLYELRMQVLCSLTSLPEL